MKTEAVVSIENPKWELTTVKNSEQNKNILIKNHLGDIQETILDTNLNKSNGNCMILNVNTGNNVDKTLLPPLPDLIPIRKSNNNQMALIETNEIYEHSNKIDDNKTNENCIESTNNELSKIIKNNQDIQKIDDNKNRKGGNRKSGRRRVARDIYFLFEEHKKKRSKQKTKKTRGRPSNSNIKNKKNVSKRNLNNQKNLEKFQNSSININDKFNYKKTINNNVPRVNPIFLWVKQDNTRIVEVRCEDYDKRNRIRLTKTPNGWRAIPRTDASTSRIVKLLPNPLLRVKTEIMEQTSKDLLKPQAVEKLQCKYNNLNSNNINSNCSSISKKHIKKKKKKKKLKNIIVNNSVESLLSSNDDPKDVIIYESTNHERIDNINNIIDNKLMVENKEPNNNENENLNLTKINDNIDINDLPKFITQNIDDNRKSINNENLIITGLSCTNSNIYETNTNDNFDVDAKHLKDLLDDPDLLKHCENAISDAELIDSLVKRGCEDTHLITSNNDNNIIIQSQNQNNHNKTTICINDFDNEDDELLMEPEPVEDIITRLGESLATSPKCLSFNEAGEIEGLHDVDIYQTNTNNNNNNSNNNINNNNSENFTRNTLEELSITIKDFEKPTISVNNKKSINDCTTLVSPDSCVDELPKDLTCKRNNDKINLQRPNSNSSDAMQSPQPSGLPALLPSPDILNINKNKNIFNEQSNDHNNCIISPKICSSITNFPIDIIQQKEIVNEQEKNHKEKLYKEQQQREPLDLGKHRKSASPTVSCSEEFNIKIKQNDIDEPIKKRIKIENNDDNYHKNLNINLLEPDPLTQLKLLINNSEWNVPDPILIPKDHLNSLLLSPGREIPLLLTTRPELRLPEAFAFPKILQDPDILVISISQLELILKKQIEINKANNLNNQIKTKTNLINSQFGGLANDIDTATLAAFNQMLWLPYFGQMPNDFIKAMTGITNNTGITTSPNTNLSNINDLMPLLVQQQQLPKQQLENQFKSHYQQQYQYQFNQQQQQQSQQHQQQRQIYQNTINNNQISFQNPLELAMWQEAINQAQIQRAFQIGVTQQQQQQQQQQQKKMTNIDIKPNKLKSSFGFNTYRQEVPTNNLIKNSSNDKNIFYTANNYYQSAFSNINDTNLMKKTKLTTQSQIDQKPRVTCKSLTNLLQSDRLIYPDDIKMSNLPYEYQNQLKQQSQQQAINHQNNLKQQENHSLQDQNKNNLQQFEEHSQNINNNSVNNNQQYGKLKVKPGAHLLDPAAMQRRLINCDEIDEVGSTTTVLDELINDPNAQLWHPLFGSTQKTGYTSPWQWTTVTATGE